MNKTISQAAIGIVVVCALMSASISTHAGLITSTSNISNNNASIQKFDSALGTLNFVNIFYDIQVNLSAIFVNRSSTPQTTTLADNFIRLDGFAPSILSSNQLEYGYITGKSLGEELEISAARTIGSTTIPTFKTIDLGFDFRREYDSRGIVIGSRRFFAFGKNQFIGNDQFNFNFAASTETPIVFSGSQPLIGTGSPSVNGTLKVEYNFTEAVVDASAPTTILLSALGIGLLVLRRNNN